MRRREFIAGLVLTTAIPFAQAQQAEKVVRIGYLAASLPAATPELLGAFRQELRQRGYVEGRNLAIEPRWAEGTPELLSQLASELVRLKVDLIVAWSTPAVTAARQATATLPIVMIGIADPIGSGFVASLARPGGNITGTINPLPDLSGELIELLIEVVPELKRVVALLNPTNPALAFQLRGIEVAVHTLSLELQVIEARAPGELEGAFATIAGGHSTGLVVLADPMFIGQRQRIADLATKSRLPTVFARRENVEAGGLLGYGPSLRDQFRQAAIHVDKILKGAVPAELPVEQPTRLELVINLKAAAALGLRIPPSILARADEVIE